MNEWNWRYRLIGLASFLILIGWTYFSNYEVIQQYISGELFAIEPKFFIQLGLVILFIYILIYLIQSITEFSSQNHMLKQYTEKLQNEGESERNALLNIKNEFNYEVMHLESFIIVISDLAKQISAVLETEQLLRVILRKSIDLLKLEKCAIFKVEESGNVTCVDCIGYDKEKISKIKLIPAEEYGLAGLSLMNKEFVYHRIISADPIKKHIIENDKFDTRFAQPLVYNNKISALLCGADYGEGITEQQAQRVLSTLANFGAIALQNTELVGKIREQSRRDSLTWLYNHQFFHERLGVLINNARKDKEDIAVLIFDVDYFKGFNDTYGHQTGDYVLKTTAEMLRSEFRGDDVVARYGGEEFVVALPKRIEKEAAVIAERIRKKLEETAFEFEGKKFSVTASFGVAAAAPSEISSVNRELLVKQADQALYKAKNTGRNRVVIHSSL